MMRWFRLLLRLFPAVARAERHSEMLDALAEVPVKAASILRESTALIRGAITSWSVYLRSSVGLARSVYFGALSWFILLVIIGPLSRVWVALAVAPDVHAWQADERSVIATAGLLALCILALPRSRWLAGALGVLGVVAAAASTRVGPWGMVDSSGYELRWLGIALVLVLIAAHRCTQLTRQPLSRGPIALCAGPVAVLFATQWLDWGGWASWATRNYGFTLRYQIVDEVMYFFSGRVFWEWASLVGIILFLVALVAHPATVALVAPPSVHLALLDPRSGVPVLLALSVAGGIRIVVRHFDFEFRVARRRR